MARNFEDSPKWLPGTICQQHGPVMFEVKLEDGRLWKHHTAQLMLQEQNHSSEPEGYLPSNGELDYDPDIPPFFRYILLLLLWHLNHNSNG